MTENDNVSNDSEGSRIEDPLRVFAMRVNCTLFETSDRKIKDSSAVLQQLSLPTIRGAKWMAENSNEPPMLLAIAPHQSQIDAEGLPAILEHLKVELNRNIDRLIEQFASGDKSPVPDIRGTELLLG
jgi:hypothetical protein